jgi:hypothetical protein
VSEEAASWAEKIRVGNARAKSVLMRLGAFADAEGVAWAAVPTLADRLECDDRTIQRALRFLEKHGFIKNTGRFRYKTVPYYALDLSGAGREAWLTAQASAKGDILSPLEGAADGQECHPKGDTAVTQNKGTNSGEGSSEPPPERARGRAVEDVCEVAFAAYPDAGRKGPSSIRLWRLAWASEVAGGASGLALLAAVRAYAGDRKAWGSSGRPVAAHTFLETGRWEGFAETSSPAAAPGPGAANGVRGWSGPAEIRADLAKAAGEDLCLNYLDWASWADGAIVARTRIAATNLREGCRRAGLDVAVLDPRGGGESRG